MRIIGIDPGLDCTGYGVIEDRGRVQAAVEGGVIRTRARESLERRLLSIHNDLREVLQELGPDAMAVEDLHSRYRNLKTAIIMGHARGVVCLVAGEQGLPVFHYQPARARNLVTGSGRADKAQVQRAVAALLRLPESDLSDHVSDAFAIALCHAMMSRSPAATATT